MAAPKRTPFEIKRDRVEISELYLQQKTQHEIADILAKNPIRKYKLSQQAISYDLKHIQQEWLQKSLMNFNEAKANELAKIDRLEREYWNGWERSRQARKKTQSEKQESHDKTKQSAKILTEDMLGDPRFLQGIQWCIDRRCQLLGLDSPKRVKVMDGDLLDKIDWNKLSKQQAERLANGEPIEKVLPGFNSN